MNAIHSDCESIAFQFRKIRKEWRFCTETRKFLFDKT